MSKLTAEINVQMVWLEELTNLSTCGGCQEKIYGKMFRLWIMPKQGKVSLRGYKTEMVFCESCCELVNDYLTNKISER